MRGVGPVLWESRGAGGDDVVLQLRTSTPTLPGQRSDWRISEHHEHPRTRSPDVLQRNCTMTDDTAPHLNGGPADLAAIPAPAHAPPPSPDEPPASADVAAPAAPETPATPAE